MQRNGQSNALRSVGSASGGNNEFFYLRLRAKAAAQLYGCEAEIQESEDCPLGSRQAVVGLKVMVARRSANGELRSRVENVLLGRHHLADAVARIVRHAAMDLPDNDPSSDG